MRNCILICLVAAFFLPFIGSDCSASLLANGAFGTPDNESWAGSSWIAWGESGRTTWAARDELGRGVGMFGWTAGSNAGLFQDVPATSGVTYTFSIWVRKEINYNEDWTHLKIEWRGAGFEDLGGTISTNIVGQAGSTYTKFTISGSTTDTLCRYARAVVMTEWSTPTNAWWATIQFDDASLVAEPAAVIMLSGVSWIVIGTMFVLCLARQRASRNRATLVTQ